MTKINTKMILKQASYAFVIATMIFAYFPNMVSAAAITDRSVAIGSSVVSASTSYDFTFKVASATVIKSASFTACTTASGVCTPAAGFAASTTLAAQPLNLGDAAGWDAADSATNVLKIKKSGNLAAPSGTQTVRYTGVTNPNTPNTFFIRIATFSDATYTAGIDNGVVAFSTAGLVTVTATVDETLTFTLATTTAALGTLTPSTTGTSTSSMTVATNARAGYTVSYGPATSLTSAAGTIPAMAAQSAASKGTKQFGINLMANTATTSTPTVGVAKSGVGSGTVSAGYDTVDQFKFNVLGDQVASAAAPTNNNVFTTSYIANVDNVTGAGFYSTALTYTATANF